MRKRDQRPIKTTRLFSLQLADHDNLFSPGEKRRRPIEWRHFLVCFPAIAFFFFPSFKLGQALMQKPHFPLPDSVVRGELFTLPGDNVNVVPQIAGRSLAFIDAKIPLFVGASPGASEFEVSFFYKDKKHNPLMRVIETLKHPKYPLFVKRIRVTPPQLIARVETLRSKTESENKLPPEFTAAATKALDRFDGNIRLRCWKEPIIDPIGVDPLRPRRHARLATLSAAGSGEVVYAGPSANGEASEVLLYHGGGLFSRYWDLKETRVQKGSKVGIGHTVGHVLLAPANHVTHARWQVFMKVGGAPINPQSELNPQSVLALSAQLCDSK
jgi:hypothetical protein